MKDEDDNPFNTTRHPFSTGHANERQMVFSVQGPMGIRTKYRTNADGSRTRLRTRAGFNEFVTEQEEKESKEESGALFLESGNTKYPSAMTMAQYYGVQSGQGEWWMTTPAAFPWLGWIKHAVGWEQDVSKNAKFATVYGGRSPTLCDGMVSPATSVKLSTDSASYLVTAMISKRKAMVTCPASMFSGKMRLFMQARYGAILDNSVTCDADFTVTVDGVQMSNLGGVGWGLFTTPDYRYFVLRFSGTSVIAYPLKARKEVSATVESLRSYLINFATADEREKAEAYIFANSAFDTEKAVTYANAIQETTPLVYGWSFKWDGSKADVISVTTVGSGIDTRFQSTHYTVAITYWKAGSVDTFGFENDTVSIDEWRDGRGSYAIFIPDYGNGGRMVAYTLGNPTHYVGSGKFYCFYRKNGELVTASYSFGGATGKPWWYDNDADWPGSSNHESPNYNDYAVVKGRRVATYKTYSGYVSGTESYQVGEITYGGAYETGNLSVQRISHGMGSAAPAQVRVMKESVVSLGSYGCTKPISGWDGTYPEPYASDTYTYKAEYMQWTEEDLGRMNDAYIQAETRLFHTVVLPFFDCCAIFTYERDAINSGVRSITRQHQTNYNLTQGSMACTGINYNPPFPPYTIRCTIPNFIGNDTYSGHTTYSTETFNEDLGPPVYKCDIAHFHGATTITPGETESLLQTLFYVNIYYPYVDAQLWTNINAGGNTAHTPIYNPDQYRRWTGWV